MNKIKMNSKKNPDNLQFKIKIKKRKIIIILMYIHLIIF